MTTPPDPPDPGARGRGRLDAMRKMPVRMIVGAADRETWEITHRPGGRHWREGANEAGRTRPERLDALRRSFEAAGIAVRFDLVPNMAHDGMGAVDGVQDFFADVLDGPVAGSASPGARRHESVAMRASP